LVHTKIREEGENDGCTKKFNRQEMAEDPTPTTNNVHAHNGKGGNREAKGNARKDGKGPRG